jgi:membrane-bound lytic murein transglycosylase D
MHFRLFYIYPLALLAICLSANAQSLSASNDPPSLPTMQAVLSETPIALKEESSMASDPAVREALRQAERHFQSGKLSIQEGNSDAARREFDLAITALLDVPQNSPDRGLAEKKFEALIRLIHRYDVESLGAGESTDQPVYVQSPLAEILDLTFPVDPRLKDKSLASVKASQSQLPLTVNDAVLSYINYFASPRGQKTLLYGLRRAGRYKAMISRILDEEGVPQELMHLAQAESAFSPMAMSRKSACGMWQFVAWRGNEYGLVRTKDYDERLDPEKSTRAAARHLRDLYNQTGDWYLAMAAYNCGPGCVDRAVQRTGHADFWELRNRGVLPRETMNYVPAILGMTIVTKNLREYGIELTDVDPPLEFDTVKVSSATNLGLIADAADRPVTDIRELNPALLRNIAPEGYEVKVPKGTSQLVASTIEMVPEERRVSWRLHRVTPGDTWSVIARRYETPANTIVAANAKSPVAALDEPASGDVLLIPVTERLAPKTAPHRAPAHHAQASAHSSKAKPAPAKSASAAHHTTKVAHVSR